MDGVISISGIIIIMLTILNDAVLTQRTMFSTTNLPDSSPFYRSISLTHQRLKPKGISISRRQTQLKAMEKVHQSQNLGVKLKPSPQPETNTSHPRKRKIISLGKCTITPRTPSQQNSQVLTKLPFANNIPRVAQQLKQPIIKYVSPRALPITTLSPAGKKQNQLIRQQCDYFPSFGSTPNLQIPLPKRHPQICLRIISATEKKPSCQMKLQNLKSMPDLMQPQIAYQQECLRMEYHQQKKAIRKEIQQFKKTESKNPNNMDIWKTRVVESILDSSRTLETMENEESIIVQHFFSESKKSFFNNES